jgi:hypothetical protein
MKTIYNTYVLMESQEQCDRMKQLCIDNKLPYWAIDKAFDFSLNYKLFCFSYNDFFVRIDSFNIKNHKIQVTEEEFIKLLPQSSE